MHIGYEIIANEACSTELAIIVSNPTSVNQEILLDLVNFALQERPEDNLMASIFGAWSNGLLYIPWH